MSWQEELRKLDEELAAGQISADDYRVRRDQVLSSAVSSGTESQSGQSGPSEATQYVQPSPPVQPAQPGQPVQPPQGGVDRTQAASGGQPDAEKTQIVSGQGPEDADRTQAVGGWQTARPSGIDADRTQIVPGIPPQSYVGGQPPRPAPSPGQDPGTPLPGFPPPPGWHQEELPPPWAGADFPPLTPQGSPEWIKQGPEVFESGSPAKTGKIIAIVAVVLLVAGLGVGAYFLFRSMPGDEQGIPPPQTISSTPPETTQKPTTSTPPPKPIVQPTGSPQLDTTFDLQRLGEAKVIGPEDYAILSRNQITETQVTVTREGELVRGTWAFTAPDAGAADQILTEFRQLYQQVGFQAVPGITKEGVSAVYFTPPDASNPLVTYRAHYVTGAKVIRVETYGPNGEQAGAEFATLLDAQLERLPAGG